jgi:predicted transcriptional regulator
VTAASALLLSVRPRYAGAILTGAKTAELRRRPVAVATGTKVILYASTPLMAVVGTARLDFVERAAPSWIWQRYRKRLGLSRAEFDTYLDGAHNATILALSEVTALPNPLPIASLRHDQPFQPPQSYRYVATTDPAALRRLADGPNVARSGGVPATVAPDQAPSGV